MRADFNFDTLRFEHFESYYQPLILRPNGVIINNRDYTQAIEAFYTLLVNGTIGLQSTNSGSINFVLKDANGDVTHKYQMFADANGITLYDVTETPIKRMISFGNNGVTTSGLMGSSLRTTADLRALDYSRLTPGLTCFDITLNKLVILRNTSPMQWVDVNGTVVIS